MGQLNSTGYEIKTFAEWKVLVQAAFTTAWPGIDLSEQGAEGVWINKLALELANADLDGLNFFNNINLNNSTGAMLDFIAILRGTARKIGTKALLQVTMTSTLQPYTIPANTQFNLTSTELIFENTVAVNITALSQSVQLQALLTGVCGASISDVLTSVQTLSTLSNIVITTVTEGTDDESDNELRIRLQAINSISSNDDVDSIYSALRNLSNTTKARVYENDSASADAHGVNPYSINAIVLGSTDQEIVDVIGVKKPAGTPTQGASSGTYVDNKGYGKTIYFDRPTQKRIYIAASVTAKPGQIAPDASYDDLIKGNCQEFINDLDIGENVSYTTVYGIFACPITLAGSLPISPFDIVSLQMSKVSASSGFAASSVAIGTREYAWVDDHDADITITVM